MPSDHKTQLQREILRIPRRIHALLSGKNTDSSYHPLIRCIISACCANLPSLIILPADYGGWGWHFYKSNGNHSRPIPAEAAWGRKSLWCASDSRGSPYLAFTCTNPRPSFTPTHRRKNPQAKDLHARAAFPGDVRINALKDCESLKSGGRKDPQSIFDGAG